MGSRASSHRSTHGSEAGGVARRGSKEERTRRHRGREAAGAVGAPIVIPPSGEAEEGREVEEEEKMKEERMAPEEAEDMHAISAQEKPPSPFPKQESPASQGVHVV